MTKPNPKSCLHFRPFGQHPEDLEIDFSLRPRPLLETAVLACSAEDETGTSPDEEFFWNLEIGERIEMLATIAAQDGAEEFSFSLGCPAADCGQIMESELMLDEIREAQHSAERKTTKPIMLNGESFSIRRPTGADQLTWLRASYPDTAIATRLMAESLLEPGCRDAFRRIACADDAWVETIEEALEERDPLLHAVLKADCPYCGTPVSSPIDLAGTALERLRLAQHSLMDTVHLLASRYHWSEREIFDVPPWRRARYRAMLEQELS